MKKIPGLRKQDERAAYAMLLPGFAFMTIFVIIPMGMAVWRSLFEYNVYSITQKFVGLENFRRMLFNETFLKSLLNVIWMTAAITVLTVVCSFFFAVILKSLDNMLSRVARVVIYVPFLVSGIVASIIFLFLTNYGGGLFNSVLISAGMQPIAFAVQGIWPYLSIILPALWLGFGYNTLIFYAGLLGIPKEYYEAAMIDGAGRWHLLVSITIPNVKNYFVLMVIGLISGNLQMFELPFMMTGGGPLDRTLTPVLYLFNLYRDPNYNSSMTIAGALIVMIPILAINLFVFKIIKSEKSMDA